MAKHTPGPWIWGENYTGLYGAGPGNNVLDYAGYEGMWLGHTDARKANAALIAAAPDMLDALKCAASVLFLLSDEVKALRLRGENVPDKVNAAIAKAEAA